MLYNNDCSKVFQESQTAKYRDLEIYILQTCCLRHVTNITLNKLQLLKLI